MELFSSKKNERYAICRKGNNFEEIKLSKLNQSQKNKYHMF